MSGERVKSRLRGMTSIDPGAQIGHVHLHVADLARAEVARDEERRAAFLTVARAQAAAGQAECACQNDKGQEQT